jgi:hypothetical protein
MIREKCTIFCMASITKFPYIILTSLLDKQVLLPQQPVSHFRFTIGLKTGAILPSYNILVETKTATTTLTDVLQEMQQTEDKDTKELDKIQKMGTLHGPH